MGKKIVYKIMNCPKCHEYVFADTQYCFWCSADLTNYLNANGKDRWGQDPVRVIELDEQPAEIKGKSYAKNVDYTNFVKYLSFIILACIFFAITKGGIFVIIALVIFAIYGLSQESEYEKYNVDGDNKYRGTINMMLNMQASRGKEITDKKEKEKNRRRLEIEIYYLEKTLKMLDAQWDEERQDFIGFYLPYMCQENHINECFDKYREYKRYQYIPYPISYYGMRPEDYKKIPVKELVIEKEMAEDMAAAMNFYHFLKEKCGETERVRIFHSIAGVEKRLSFSMSDNLDYAQIITLADVGFDHKDVLYLGNLYNWYAEYLEVHPERKKIPLEQTLDYERGLSIR